MNNDNNNKNRKLEKDLKMNFINLLDGVPLSSFVIVNVRKKVEHIYDWTSTRIRPSCVCEIVS